MSKEDYFNLCEQLSSEPIESEIPLDISDFPELVQSCFLIYEKLTDIWDGMSDSYFGKDYSIIFKLFEVYYIDNVDEQRLALDIIKFMDISRTKLIASKKAPTK